MRRSLFLVIAATLAACETMPAGKGEPQVIKTEVIDPASVPPPPAPVPYKPSLIDPPAGPPVAEAIATEPLVDEPAEPAEPGAFVDTSKDGITLVSNGAEPRFALHYQAVAGATEKLSMTNAMTMSMPPQPALIFPKTIVGATVTATKVAADGTMTLAIKLTSADAKDVKGSAIPAAQVKAQMTDVVGLETTILVDAHGHMTDLQGKEIQQSEQSQLGFNQLTAALPVEAVGKGAKWKIRQKVDQGALKVDQVVTFEVLEVTATTANLRAKGRLSAPRQMIDWQGQQVDLEKTSGSSSADLVIDFTRLVPEVKGSVEMTMKMQANGESAEMTTKSVMTMHAK